MTAPQSGWLKGPRVKQGAKVRAGQVLGVIVPPGFTAQLREARANLKLASVRLQAAKRLYHHSYTAKLDLDLSRDNWVAAKAKLDQLIREQRSNTLRSPAGGTAYYRYPAGAYINDANVTPVVADIDLSRPIWLRLYVTESAASRLRRGSKVHLMGSDWKGQGKVRSINSSSQKDGMFEVLVSLPSSKVLHQGQWMRARLCPNYGPAWRVPEKALLINRGHAQVYVIDGSQRAIPINVHIVSSSHRWVWIKGKLSRSSKVVVRGADLVRKGLKVHTRPVNKSH